MTSLFHPPKLVARRLDDIIGTENVRSQTAGCVPPIKGVDDV
jgi:hypothetical protein